MAWPSRVIQDRGIEDCLILEMGWSVLRFRFDEKDKWKKWVFSLSASGWFNGEEQYNSLNTYSNLSIDKVTDKWKFQFGYGYNYNISKYLLDDTWIVSERKCEKFNKSLVTWDIWRCIKFII